MCIIACASPFTFCVQEMTLIVKVEYGIKAIIALTICNGTCVSVGSKNLVGGGGGGGD